MSLLSKPTVQYVAVINEQTFRFNTRHELFAFVKKYRDSFNEIYQISLHKIKMFTLKP